MHDVSNRGRVINGLSALLCTCHNLEVKNVELFIIFWVLSFKCIGVECVWNVLYSRIKPLWPGMIYSALHVLHVMISP